MRGPSSTAGHSCHGNCMSFFKGMAVHKFHVSWQNICQDMSSLPVWEEQDHIRPGGGEETWRVTTKDVFFLVIAPQIGQVGCLLQDTLRVESWVIPTSLAQLHQSVAEIQGHFLFGGFAVKFDWTTEAMSFALAEIFEHRRVRTRCRSRVPV